MRRLAVWVERSRYGQVYLSGRTEYPRTKEAEPAPVPAKAAKAPKGREDAGGR